MGSFKKLSNNYKINTNKNKKAKQKNMNIVHKVEREKIVR